MEYNFQEFHYFEDGHIPSSLQLYGFFYLSKLQHNQLFDRLTTKEKSEAASHSMGKELDW